MTERNIGLVCGLLASVTFAIYVLINRYVYLNYKVDNLSYATTFLLAGALFALIAIVLQPSKRRVVFRRHTLPVVLNGILAGAGIGFLVFGQAFTSAVNASIIITTSVVTTLIFAKIFLGERFSRKQIMWVGVMFVGLYFAIVGTNLIRLSKGDLIIVGAAIMLGFTNVFSKMLMKHNGSGFIADVRLVSGGIFFGLVGVIVLGSGFLITSAGPWALLAGLFFWLTIKFMYAAINHIGPGEAIVLGNAHALVTPAFAVLLLGEPYSWIKFIGSVVLIVSIYLIAKNKNTGEHTTSTAEA